MAQTTTSMLRATLPLCLTAVTPHLLPQRESATAVPHRAQCHTTQGSQCQCQLRRGVAAVKHTGSVARSVHCDCEAQKHHAYYTSPLK